MQQIARVGYWSFVGLVAVAILVPLLGLDRFTLFMAFTYTPRVFWIGLSVALAVGAASQRAPKIVLLMLCMAAAHLMLSPVGLGRGIQSPEDLTILSFNTHNPYDRLEEFREFCRSTDADIVCFQEIQPEQRDMYLQAFSEYEFYSADPLVDFEHKDKWSFSNLTGFRKGLLAECDVQTFTGITGYRTFAVNAKIATPSGPRPIYIVNVHSTKPANVAGPRHLMWNLFSKSRRHRKENKKLRDWLSRNSDGPIIACGDFNAPSASHNLRLPTLRSAQQAAGVGLHVTFPANFPVFGIDHILGNDQIRFSSYRRINTGVSDHVAQVATFQFAD